MLQRRLGDGEAKSAIDAALDRVDFRLGHGGERRRRDRFRRGHRRSTKNRLHDLRFRNYLNWFGLHRLALTDFAMNWLRLTMIDWLGLMEFVAGRLSGRKKRFQSSHDVFDLFFSKLKAIKLPDNSVEFGMCDFKSRKVILAIGL
jgi:hypothetical protein